MRYRRWGRKSAFHRRRNRAEESAARREAFHEDQVAAARTPDARLAACFDRFRATQSAGAFPGMTQLLMARAHALQGWMGRPELEERHLAAIGEARTHKAKLTAAFNWYRATAAAARREYGDDGDFLALLHADILEIAACLNGGAVARAA